MPKKDANKALNDRAQHLLKVLVNHYIEDGQPVGSKTLAEAAKLDVSPATIRNVMSQLEDLGFIESPHTSAGRVPTIQGYRFFVDSLVDSQPVAQKKLLDELQEQLENNKNPHELAVSVSEFLSGVTRLAGVVTLPKVQQIILSQIEFIPLSERRVLAILVTSDDEVQNRILDVQRDFKLEELQLLSSYFNDQFSGMEVTQVRQMLVSQMRNDQDSMNHMMNVAMEMADSLLGDEQPEEDYILAGQSNLMGMDKISNVERLRQLFDAFNQKQEVLNLLDQCVNTEGVQIFIGNESGYKIFDDCSVVSSSYSINGQSLGVLGVIGPTRMQYDRIIPIVDVTAKVLGAVLNSRS